MKQKKNRGFLFDIGLAALLVLGITVLHSQSYSFFGDAPEVSLLALNLGYAHPPGFMFSQSIIRVLYQFNLWTGATLSGYLLGHWLSVLFAILTISLALTILRNFRVDAISRCLYAIALITNFIFVYNAWLPEYFMAATFLVMLTILSAFKFEQKWRNRDANNEHYIHWFTGFLAGVTVAQHQYTLVFLLPFFCILADLRRPILTLYALLAAMGGYLILLGSNLTLWHEQALSVRPSFLWGHLTEVSGILHYLLRKDYGTFRLLDVEEVINWNNHYYPVLKLTGAWLLLPLALIPFKWNVLKSLYFGTISLIIFVLFALSVPYAVGTDLFLIERFLLLPIVLIPLLFLIQIKEQYKLIKWIFLCGIICLQLFALPEKIASYNVKTMNHLLNTHENLLEDDDWLLTNSETLGLGLKYFAYYKRKNINLMFESFCQATWMKNNFYRFNDGQSNETYKFICNSPLKSGRREIKNFRTLFTYDSIEITAEKSVTDATTCQLGLLFAIKYEGQLCKSQNGKIWDRIEDPMGNKFILNLLNHLK